jgi:hypothetical protein
MIEIKTIKDLSKEMEQHTTIQEINDFCEKKWVAVDDVTTILKRMWDFVPIGSKIENLIDETIEQLGADK